MLQIKGKGCVGISQSRFGNETRMLVYTDDRLAEFTDFPQDNIGYGLFACSFLFFAEKDMVCLFNDDGVLEILAGLPAPYDNGVSRAAGIL